MKNRLFLILFTAVIIGMRLKYQSEIDKFGLTDCPAKVYAPKDENVFRFSYNPIEHEHNFLPNVLIDKIKNAPFDYDKSSSERKCLRCGASYFLSAKAAIDRWRGLPIQFKENFGYTHIASGVLKQEDGVMSTPQNNHFTFYESDVAQLVKSFQNIIEL